MRKHSIVDVGQGSEYDRALNIPGFRIQQGSKYPNVLIIKRFWIYHDSEYASGTEYTKDVNIPRLQRVVNIPVNMCAYIYIYIWICYNAYEYTTSPWMAFDF